MDLIRAQWVLDGERGLVADGVVQVEQGKIVQVVSGAASIRRLVNAVGEEPSDLGSGVLCPGLVNAHAHLELTALKQYQNKSIRSLLVQLYFPTVLSQTLTHEMKYPT